MRLKAISLAVAVSFALSNGAQAYSASKYTEGDCRPGGDGPKPMLELPNFFGNVHPFTLPDGLLDGMFLPKSNSYVFRNSATKLTVARFSTHSFNTMAAEFNAPISKVRDASERYFSPEGTSRVFDAANRVWMNYHSAYEGKIRPLFWNGSHLYSAVTSEDENRNASFRLQRWTVGTNRARRVCNLSNFFLNSGYKLGNGHAYPFMVLHRTERVGTQRKLTVSFLDVESCTVSEKPYADLMKGEVLNVHYFAKMKSVLIQVDHPTQNLVWDTGPDDAHCHYYSLANSKLVMVGYEHPIIGAYDPHDGLSLIYMHDKDNNPPQTAQVTGDWPIADIKPYDLELSPDKMSLVGITELIDKSKTLVKIDLPKID